MNPTSVLLIAAAAWSAAPARPADVRVYLPRSVKVTGERLTLADVGVVRCDDDATERHARTAPLGRAPWPREKLTFDRTTVLSVLAGRGIPRGRVRLSGAEVVTVSRLETVVSAERILAAAEDFLRRQPAEKANDCIYRLLRRPEELVVPGRAEDITFACRLGPSSSSGRVTVLVAARRGDRQVALREASFQRLYRVRRAVVRREIPAGVVVSPENVEIHTDYAPQRPEPWKPPFGLLARRRLAPGMVITDALVAEKKPDLVIRRNQVVQMRVQGLGFTVLAVGQALQEGRPGDFIRVRNVDSKRVVTVRVAFDGSVEPVLLKR